MLTTYQYKAQLQELISKLSGPGNVQASGVNAPGPEWYLKAEQVIQMPAMNAQGQQTLVPMLWLLWVKETSKPESVNELLGHR